ncbi:MAG: sulfite exporter TauE/SafE family protein [Candidatus Hydrothermarchaeaceae archaeon]
MEAGWTILFLGFMLGLKHALDADHVVAVSAIVSENRDFSKSSLLGVFWGLGHAITLLFVGLLLLIFKISIPKKIVLSMELFIGVVLVLLGFSVLSKIHMHRHTHSGAKHRHLHSHNPQNSHGHVHKSFVVGMIHGLAGSGALLLIVLSTMDTVTQGIFYILIFGLGSLLGMLLISTAIGLPLAATENFENLNMKIRTLAGIFGILLGVAIIVEIGFSQGYFYRYF